MRNRRSVEIVSVLAIGAALAVIVLSSHEFGPRADRKLHAAIGKALAKETLKLRGQAGPITVITRDTKAFPQPALEILQSSFNRELQSANASVATTKLIQIDPLRPTAVPAGDFFELIRRASAEQVIVSFLGPPQLSEEQRSKLDRVKPKIVAFCSDSQMENADLRPLFDAGLLHAAVMSKKPSSGAAGTPQTAQTTFEQLYTTVTAANCK